MSGIRGALTLHPMYRRLLKLTLEELRLIEKHLGQLDQTMPTYSPRIVRLYCASPNARYRQGASVTAVELVARLAIWPKT